MNGAAVALVWLGIVIGVAFLATPVKFTAPSLELSTALEIGRVTFRLLARVEWVLAALLVAVAMLGRERLPWSVAVPIAVIVLEALWLTPMLGARTDAIRSGHPVPASALHRFFIAGKLLECAALGHIAWAMSRNPAIPMRGMPP